MELETELMRARALTVLLAIAEDEGEDTRERMDAAACVLDGLPDPPKREPATKETS